MKVTIFILKLILHTMFNINGYSCTYLSVSYNNYDQKVTKPLYWKLGYRQNKNYVIRIHPCLNKVFFI